MKKSLKIGLIGFGAMGKTHSFCINSIPYFYEDANFSAAIHSVCTKNPDNAKSATEKYGFNKFYTDENDLISDKSIDIIDICTPNIYHYDTIKKALFAGKHVLCEKPLCITYNEAKEIETLARNTGTICGIVFNNRFLSPVLRAKQLVNSGRIGEILSFNGEYFHNSCLDMSKSAGWKQNADFGGGVLFDLGSHVIDLIYYLCGEFKAVCGISQIGFPIRKGLDGANWETNAEEGFFMTSTLKNGAVGTICVSKLIAGANDDLNIKIYGKKGSLRFSLMQPNWLYFYDCEKGVGHLGDIYGGDSGYTRIECVERYGIEKAFPSVKAPQGWLRGHIGSMYSFLSCVADGKSFSPSFSEALHVQAVIEAAHRSSIQRKEEIVL